MYDITRRDTFNHLTRWLEEARQNSNSNMVRERYRERGKDRVGQTEATTGRLLLGFPFVAMSVSYFFSIVELFFFRVAWYSPPQKKKKNRFVFGEVLRHSRECSIPFLSENEGATPTEAVVDREKARDRGGTKDGERGEGGSETRGDGGGGGGGGAQFVHGRGRVTIDPRIPTMPERSTSNLHQPGRHCLNQARSAVRCSASRMKGELHPSKNRT